MNMCVPFAFATVASLNFETTKKAKDKGNCVPAEFERLKITRCGISVFFWIRWIPTDCSFFVFVSGRERCPGSARRPRWKGRTRGGCCRPTCEYDALLIGRCLPHSLFSSYCDTFRLVGQDKCSLNNSLKDESTGHYCEVLGCFARVSAASFELADLTASASAFIFEMRDCWRQRIDRAKGV